MGGVEPLVVRQNDVFRGYLREISNHPTFLETNLPGNYPGINYMPPIRESIRVPSGGGASGGCRLIFNPTSSNMCPSRPAVEVWCGQVLESR